MVIDLSKAQRKVELKAAKRAIEEIARREGQTVEQVRKDMTEAILEGWNCPDPQTHAVWTQIPCEGEIPTPEELLAWMKKCL